MIYSLLIKQGNYSAGLFTIKKPTQKIELSLPLQQAGPSINEIDPPAGEVNYGLPVRLKIPSISSNSSIEYVGITAQKEMAVPKNIENAAWYELGPRPGETGSAVIAGHYGWKNGEVSVFDNLKSVAVGDLIYIEDDKGVTLTFIVHEIRTYEWKEDTTNVFTSYDGKSHLNLITCNGVWNKAEKSYSKRLVIFTDKIN